MIGLATRSVTWNRFPIKILWLIPRFLHLWNKVTLIQICASLNHRKKMKAGPSRLIPWKPIENVELFIVKRIVSRKYWYGVCFSLEQLLRCKFMSEICSRGTKYQWQFLWVIPLGNSIPDCKTTCYLQSLTNQSMPKQNVWRMNIFEEANNLPIPSHQKCYFAAEMGSENGNLEPLRHMIARCIAPYLFSGVVWRLLHDCPCNKWVNSITRALGRWGRLQNSLQSPPSNMYKPHLRQLRNLEANGDSGECVYSWRLESHAYCKRQPCHN